ncbi:MAG: chondroitinase-B domain-containing protein [Pseudomonadota bacterium]
MMRILTTRSALIYLLPSLLAGWSMATPAATDNPTLVGSFAEYEKATAALRPGDTVVLKDGTWRDVELVFKAIGREDAPVTLRAQTPGKVIISGESNLAISGEHIVVSGLVFADGFTPTSEVISYRTAKNELAVHTRVTNVVIDDFSNPERHSADTWVAIYGKHNRFDHNSLLYKGNRGVTLAVRMDTEASRENGHLIERNYFGPRQTLGSNGGETLRIGTSHYSREYANPVVRENYFDRTSGELEIISSKSCGNEISGNVFFESQGTLTMRHGHYTTVERNYFLGNRQPNTGGIRIINEHQTVRRNYLYGLTGHRFRGALVIMNGVPNGPINRYDPVIDSVLNNNVVIDSDHIQLCAGADEERSAPPTGTTMHNNLILTQTNDAPFTVYDDISGINFSGNTINEGLSSPVEQGFKRSPYAVWTNAAGLRVPAQHLLDQIGFGEVRLPITKADTGASFYPKPQGPVAFRSGREIPVAPGTNTILDAMRASRPGDVLVLDNAGEYLLTKYAPTFHAVSITAPSGDKPIIRSEKSSFFIIENGGSLELDNVWVDGAESPDLAGNNVISTSRYSMNRNYSLVVRNSRVTNLDVNHSYDFLKVYRSTFADRIEVLDTQMSNVTGAILALDKETDDLGIYNVENLRIEGSTFEDVQGAVANLYRGGTDESTFGPIVTIADNALTNVGNGKRNRSGASMRFHGVQRLHIRDSNWAGSAPLALFLTNGEPITEIRDVVMQETPPIRANHDGYKAENVTYQ